MTISTTPTTPAPPWPLLGQEQAVSLLQGAISRNAISHAYLVAGPPQSGRGTLAHLFAQTLLCETPAAAGGPPLAPCGICRACRKISRGTHPDVQTIGLASQEAAGNQRRRDAKHTTLSIDTVRALASNLSLRPMEGRWRVAIVEDAETIRDEAANSFLKTLEEPPSYAVIILLVTEAGTVLPTIRSRCQLVETRPVPRDALAAALTAQHQTDPATAATLAALARGRAGWALEAAQQPDFLATRREQFDAMLALLHGPAFDFFPLVDRLTEQFRKGQRDEVYAVLDRWLGLWRDLLLLREGCDDLLLNVDYTDQLRTLADRCSSPWLREATAATAAALRQLSENIAPRLALEAMVLRWHYPEQAAPKGT